MLGVHEAELAPHGEVWVASADVSEGDLKIEIKGGPTPRPAPTSRVVHDGYVSVTPLMSIVRGPGDAGRGRRDRGRRAWARILPERSGKRKRRQTNAPCRPSTPRIDGQYSSERHDVTRPLHFPSPEW